MMRTLTRTCFCAALLAGASLLDATETENLGLRILPAPGVVTVDGKTDDWDLSGGIFACSDVENSASRYAVWIHAMYDRENLYVLARWVDPTPMNNPGSVKGDYGFNGDCLQARLVTAPDVTSSDVTSSDPKAKDAALMRTTHVGAWRDREGLDVIDLAYGRHFNEGGLKDAKKEGASQAFLKTENGKGYVQEIALPWKLLTKPGLEIKAGSRILFTVEPNFTVGTGGRLTIKDLFKPGVAVDRVFTFQGNGCWGLATLEAEGRVAPRPVRLSDGREFPVRMENGVPVVDWTGLIKSRMPQGFKTLKVSVPADGYVSLNLFAPDGTVARQLLTAHFLTKGDHEIQWDGLTTPSARQPGQPVSPGEYSWEAIYHGGIGLKLRGWAANSGSAPWQGWGADHGNPQACAAVGDQVFVGWGAGEGDKPLLACDLDGNIQWKNIRGGIAGAAPVAADGKTVYAFNDVGGYAARAIYRVDARTGRYTEWSSLKSTDLTMKDLWGDVAGAPQRPSGLAAAGGRVFVSFNKEGVIFVVDAETGGIVKKLTVSMPGTLAARSADTIYTTSGSDVVSVNVASGETKVVVKPVLQDKDWVSALTVGRNGALYLGIRGTQNQVTVHDVEGKLLRTIGRKGGRALLGPWTPDGMLNIAALAVDAKGKLWVAEDDGTPRRVSVWNGETGTFVKEFFGASSYGAVGAAVNPQDPNLMVGQGCEWRIDPKTGRSICLGTLTREGMGGSRFGFGPGGRLYLVSTPSFLHGPFPLRIYERLGDATYKLRSHVVETERAGSDKKKIKSVEVWSDANDDGIVQPEEVKTREMDLGGWPAGWYLSVTPDLSLYGSLYQVRVTGWTSCGAPEYDLAKAKLLPAPADAKGRGGMGAQRGHGSADGRYMLWNAGYGLDHGVMDCYDIETGKLAWRYPSNFTGVHGSHRAGGPEGGQMRGAYDITGAAKFPVPVGNVWVIPTNKGEWHVLTEKGYYLTRLFEGDPTRNVWPEQAVPGASLDTCPPGAGEEAFGGSITQALDGSLFVQAGHVSFWNAEVTGLDTIRALPGGRVSISESEVEAARSIRERSLAETTALKRLVVRRATPVFTGVLDRDFAGATVLKYQKDAATACRSAAAWDDQNLYVAWEVKDGTPWVNGTDAPEFLYARGDTVDLQLGLHPEAPKDRKEAGLGDLRISIGPWQGRPLVMAYRRVSKEKHPKTFNSGVTQGYVMESVVQLDSAKVEVKVDSVGKRYVVEAALPWSALGRLPACGDVLRGDFGATHGDRSGTDTVLRTYWSNQNTGLVSDEVYELAMTPSAWGELELER